MTPQEIKKSVSESPLTTIAGGLTTVSGLAISLIPNHVWETCSTAIAETSNPVFTGSLVAVGLSLTLIGPSLARAKR